MKKVLILLICCISFSACDNGELERLRQENASLKAQIAELSETEQNRFNKAVDLFNTANDLQSYRLAEETFASFIEKFPTSSYLESAKRHKQQAKNKADNIEKVANTKTEITSLITQRKWGAATNKVNSIKTLINKEEYNALLKQIREERYKPEKTTIDRLVVEIDGLNGDRLLNFIEKGKRVEIIGYATSFIDVKNKSFTVYGKGCGKGEHLEVFYENTKLTNYFLDLNSQCGDKYRIVGTAHKALSLFGVSAIRSDIDVYIIAETIERI